MGGIKFSIIVPIYNVEDYLQRCIESLINQSYRNIEIILVNDGSPDKCPQICDNYANNDNRIRVIHKKNGGLSDARNFGLKEAKGEYVIFVDSDDYIEIATCEEINKIISKVSIVDIVASNLKIKTNKGFKKFVYSSIQENAPINGSVFLKTQLKNKTMFMSACRNIYRRLFLIDNELYFKVRILHEDEQWTPRVFLKAESVVFTGYAHYIRVIREGSITRRRDKTQNAIDLMETVKELSIIYASLDDNELKRLLNNYLVMLYLNAFYIGRMYRKECMSYVDKTFLKGKATSFKNRIKVALFRFNTKLYYISNKLFKLVVQ
jgi:glycosyltransferase involved in cell wall biosynthesis